MSGIVRNSNKDGWWQKREKERGREISIINKRGEINGKREREREKERESMANNTKGWGMNKVRPKWSQCLLHKRHNELTVICKIWPLYRCTTPDQSWIKK